VDNAGNTGASEMICFSISKQPMPFPIGAAAAIVVIGGGGTALLFYFTRFKKTTGKKLNRKHLAWKFLSIPLIQQ